MPDPNHFTDPAMIIEAAICPFRFAAPVWDEQGMIDEANACLVAGAAIVHHHHDFRFDTNDSISEMLALGKAVKASHPDALLYPDFLKGSNVQERTDHIAVLAEAGVLGMVPVDPGRANSGQLDEHGLPGGDNKVQFTFDDANYTLALARHHRLPLAIGVFEPYHLRWALAQAKAGKLPQGSMVKLYFGGRYSLINAGQKALNFGLTPTRAGLDAYLEMLEGSGLAWCVGLMGDTLLDSPLARHAVERGGHLRIGIEDIGGTSDATNVEMVEAAVDLANQVGRPVVQGQQALLALDLKHSNEKAAV